MLKEGYRPDIDGLRAIAVIAVIIFHFGYLPNGYLGVDVFFVISGYLITEILFREITVSQFSIGKFYIRRIRRIIPLVLFINLVALIFGAIVMLPDDLENLSQSVVGTNLFSNNILQFITIGNYWDVLNEYKPLMHTWSLGIEEQFYLIYPFIFILVGSKKPTWILPILLFLTLISITLFLSKPNESSKYYLIQFRFFEISLGGVGSLLFKNDLVRSKYTGIQIAILVLILFTNLDLSSSIKVCLTVFVTFGILISSNNQNKIGSYILTNKAIVGIGKISFSLYMWHQVVLAFTRYLIVHDMSIEVSCLIFIIILFFSILTYTFIEQPFRDNNSVKVKVLLWSTGAAFVISTCLSLYLYSRSGVIYDIPELGIVKSDAQRNLHSKYNYRVYNFDRKFDDETKIKILVIGNSFARDWVNILLESKYRESIEISYTPDISKCEDRNERLRIADYVFFSEISKVKFNSLEQNMGMDTVKVWVIGTKNFGENNGIYFNKRHRSDYCSLKTNMEEGYSEKNDSLRNEWRRKYVDLIGMVIDSAGMVPVFTPDCKFISQDCRHLNKSGAIYFAQLLENNNNFRIE